MNDEQFFIIPIDDSEDEATALARWKRGENPELSSFNSINDIKQAGFRNYEGEIPWLTRVGDVLQEGIPYAEIQWPENPMEHPTVIQRNQSIGLEGVGKGLEKLGFRGSPFTGKGQTTQIDSDVASALEMPADILSGGLAGIVGALGKQGIKKGIKNLDMFFKPRSVELAMNQGPFSRDTVVEITPNEFLGLAEKLETPKPENIANVRRLLENGTPFSDLPVLSGKPSKEGKFVLDAHDGRHRATALSEMGLGDKPMKVILEDNSGKLNWKDDLPTEIIGQDNETILSMPEQTRKQNIPNLNPGEEIKMEERGGKMLPETGIFTDDKGNLFEVMEDGSIERIDIESFE